MDELLLLFLSLFRLCREETTNQMCKIKYFSCIYFSWWSLAPFYRMEAFSSSPPQYLQLCLVPRASCRSQTLQPSVTQNRVWIPELSHPFHWGGSQRHWEKLVFSLSIQLPLWKKDTFGVFFINPWNPGYGWFQWSSQQFCAVNLTLPTARNLQLLYSLIACYFDVKN